MKFLSAFILLSLMAITVNGAQLVPNIETHLPSSEEVRVPNHTSRFSFSGEYCFSILSSCDVPAQMPLRDNFQGLEDLDLLTLPQRQNHKRKNRLKKLSCLFGFGCKKKNRDHLIHDKLSFFAGHLPWQEWDFDDIEVSFYSHSTPDSFYWSLEVIAGQFEPNASPVPVPASIVLFGSALLLLSSASKLKRPVYNNKG